MATQLVRKSPTGPPNQVQPQLPKSSSSEAYGASRPQNAPPAVPGCPACLQSTHEQTPSSVISRPRRVPEDGASEGSTEYNANFAAPHSSSEGTRLELERQLSVPLAVQPERGHRIAQPADELALKSARLKRAEASAAEAERRAGPELRQYTDDQRLMGTSLVKQRVCRTCGHASKAKRVAFIPQPADRAV